MFPRERQQLNKVNDIYMNPVETKPLDVRRGKERKVGRVWRFVLQDDWAIGRKGEDGHTP